MVEVPLNEHLGGRRLQARSWQNPDAPKVLEEVIEGGAVLVAAT
jgi:hypothetical protein